MNNMPPLEKGRPSDPENKKPPWRVALLANLNSDFSPLEGDPDDAGAEFDSPKTIAAITEALAAEGHQVFYLPANAELPDRLASLKPDICFNIAEGLGGDGREAQIPAMCELLGIPYTASRVVTNAVALDKALTKRIWSQAGLPTAAFIEARRLKDLEQISLSYPLFVKPAREGSGMGITRHSIIQEPEELHRQGRKLLEAYQQPILIEEFLPGREFTVGFIGNPGSSWSQRQPALYDSSGYHFFPILEIDSSQSISPAIYGHHAKSKQVGSSGAPGYLCPAEINSELASKLISLTRQAAEALNVCDVSRVDFRLDRNQEPRLLEINTLPGLSPGYSDLCIQASAEGFPYQTLISEILYLAAERFQLPFPTSTARSRTASLQTAPS